MKAAVKQAAKGHANGHRDHKPARKRGRPTFYSERIAREICERLAAGEALIDICRSPGMPADSTVEVWSIEEHPNRPGFPGMYARARDRGLERLAEEVLSIADEPCLFNGEPDPSLVQQARLRVDARKWYLSKRLPKIFGDKVTQEVTGPEGQALLAGAGDPSKVALILLNIMQRRQIEAQPVIEDGQDDGREAISPRNPSISTD